MQTLMRFFKNTDRAKGERKDSDAMVMPNILLKDLLFKNRAEGVIMAKGNTVTIITTIVTPIATRKTLIKGFSII